MKALVLKHHPVESPGLLGKALVDSGWELEVLELTKGKTVPTESGDYQGIILMGGPISVNDEKQYPFLEEEIALIGETIGRNIPVIGVCLGAQLIARALGGAVSPNMQKEIGWHPIQLTEEGKSDTLFASVNESEIEVFHWHSESFAVPENAVLLARSELSPCQIFRYGCAYGFLCHLEITPMMVEQFVRVFADQIPSEISSERILAGTAEKIETYREISTGVFEKLANLWTKTWEEV